MLCVEKQIYGDNGRISRKGSFSAGFCVKVSWKLANENMILILFFVGVITACMKVLLLLESIYLYFPPVVPAIIFVFLSCRPFVAITTLSTGLVGVEVTSVSWLGQLTVGV